ncbi:DMT family transporter [Halosolutus gelatinilyticus]|uniref:DMT family transporter n=1 Tax=Halosolutus gelatinilyticus TaxID=2931975 RepID=UPI001FF225D7|nr:EamA family transporter [Halosolutus gelatinilyticus]
MARALDVALFLLLAVLWGFSFPAISVGLEYLPPILFAAVRYDVAAVLLLGYAAFRAGTRLPREKNDVLAIVGGGVFLVAGNGMLFYGQQNVPSGAAAIIQALVPIFTALWALLLLGERLSPLGAAGVAIGFVGIGFVVRPDPTNLLAGDTVARLFIVCQVVSVALGTVLVQRAGPTLPRIPLTGWSMLVGALVLHAVSAGLGEAPAVGALASTAVAMILYLGVFSTAIAFLIYFTILEEHGAFEAALVAYLVPIVATIVGVFVLGESITALTFVGFGLVATGFALLKRRAIADVTGIASSVGRP